MLNHKRHRFLTASATSTLYDAAFGLIEGIRQGLGVLRTPRRLAGVMFWSLVLWLVNALAFYVGYTAFGIPPPPALASVIRMSAGTSCSLRGQGAFQQFRAWMALKARGVTLSDTLRGGRKRKRAHESTIASRLIHAKMLEESSIHPQLARGAES